MFVHDFYKMFLVQYIVTGAFLTNEDMLLHFTIVTQNTSITLKCPFVLELIIINHVLVYRSRLL